MRSDTVKKGKERAPHRSLLKACGLTDADMDKPFIAIANSYTDVVPGHIHLDKVGEFVKACVREAGGVPLVFNTIGVDDGIAMGHEGMKFSLPSRELRRDHDPSPLFRRDGVHSQLRQDHPGHADGGCADQRAHDLRQRRADGGRTDALR
jgi:hypothetical protein